MDELDEPHKLNRFSIRISELRKIKNKTQHEVAEHLHVARTTYLRYESGDYEPSIDTLIKLADFYNVSVDYLIGRIHLRNYKDEISEQEIMIGIMDLVKEQLILRLGASPDTYRR